MLTASGDDSGGDGSSGAWGDAGDAAGVRVGVGGAVGCAVVGWGRSDGSGQAAKHTGVIRSGQRGGK